MVQQTGVQQTGAKQAARRLVDVSDGVIRPFNQTELKAATATLKDLARQEPVIAELMAGETALRTFIANALTLSPYLRDIANLKPALMAEAISQPLEPLLATAVAEARAAWVPSADGIVPTEAEVMTRLRNAKRRVSFLTALADLARIFDARNTTAWLSAVADATVAAAIDHLLLAGHQAGKLTLRDMGAPAAGSGLIVLGMGKLGACELNYSSDIDLVVFFDPDAGILKSPDDATETYGRMMRRLVRILQERTADGYVFRTDLRLRPDPGSETEPCGLSFPCGLFLL